MSNVARSRTRRWRRLTAAVAMAAAAAIAVSGCSSGSSGSGSGKVTLTFSQWWAPEMPAGALQKIVNGFEKEHPNITVKLISSPFASLQTQTFSEAAAGTLPDIVGLDGSWVNPLYKQGALLNLTKAMKSAKFNSSELASQVGYSGSTYMIPVVNFVYPLFTNDTILAEAGISTPPTTWSEFEADAQKITQKTSAKGWIVPLGTTNPNGAQNDILSWAWASGGSMLKNGEPDLTNNTKIAGAVDLVKGLVKGNDVVPGANSLQETDKIENFVNGRVGMMIDSMAHITTITKANPKFKFTVSAQPAEDSYTGTRGLVTASWGIGVSAKSAHPTQDWQFVQYLLSKQTNSQLSTLADGFPGNKQSTPDFTGTDPHFKQAFAIYQKSKPTNEFTGLPSANQLMTDFDTEFQNMLSNGESTSTMLANVQKQWKSLF